MLEKIKNNKLAKIIFINFIIFAISNIIFDLKYEQVDDFIIYKLYSGLDGTNGIFGVYVHPILCAIIWVFYKLIPAINWHTIFLLSMQFICFTIMGYLIVDKQKNRISFILYTIFASVSYGALLLLIQYTSVAALLIATALFIIISQLENEEHSKAWISLSCILFFIGIMLRMQSLLIIAPFFALYIIIYFIKWIRNHQYDTKLKFLMKMYLIFVVITAITYGSNYVIYNSNETYRKYTQYNKLRTVLQDLSFTKYEDNKEIFDKIGWSQNDHYLFYTVNFGDENVYTKENLQEIVDYKTEKNEYYNLNLDIKSISKNLMTQINNQTPYITIYFLIMFGLSNLFIKKIDKTAIGILLVTVAVNLIFIILNRNLLRVVIPEYIFGTALMIYNLKSKEKKNSKFTFPLCIVISIVLTIILGAKYQYGYKLENYKQYQNLINYTNENKENAYLYTVPSLQYRYLAYSIYTMPPKESFSNLRVIGGWDMFTQNYYNFKERYDLEGTFLDMLKENVYVIDGNVRWSGTRYEDYIEHIVLFIEENYNINVEYEKIEEFDNLYIYKLYQI